MAAGASTISKRDDSTSARTFMLPISAPRSGDSTPRRLIVLSEPLGGAGERAHASVLPGLDDAVDELRVVGEQARLRQARRQRRPVPVHGEYLAEERQRVVDAPHVHQ